jgi:hypothetical protein
MIFFKYILNIIVMRKFVFITIILLIFSTAYSQSPDTIPRIIFGFDLGINYSNAKIKNVNPGVSLRNSAGLRLGVLADCRLNDHLSCSPKGELAFNGSQVIINDTPDGKVVIDVYPATLDLALHELYKFGVNRRSRPYLLAGPGCRVPLAGNNKLAYATMRSDLAIDVGVGLEKRMQYFNISPEIRYSMGLTDLTLARQVGQLYFHTITCVLIFKG